MPAPVTDIDSEPKMAVCFNEDWMPALVTALKLLTRPEAWTGDTADIITACENAHRLIGNVQDGCPSLVQGPNWYLFAIINDGESDPNAYATPEFGLTPEGLKYALYDLVIWGDATHTPDATTRGLTIVGNDRCGGVFEYIRVSNASDPAGQAFVLTTIDCLGNTVIHSDFTPMEYTGSFKSFRIVGGNSTVYFIKSKIVGDYECVET
jgi:hypothetical protein